MADPASSSPTPAKKNNPVLIGCLVVAAIAVVGVIVVLALGVFLAKREEDAKTPAQRVAEKAAEMQHSHAEEASRLEPTLAEAKVAQARFATIATAVAATSDLKRVPCPHVDGEPLEFAPVDAEFMGRFHGAIPRDVSGTPWFRHKAFSDLADELKNTYANPENDAYAAIRADKDLAGVGRIAVIHTLSLKEPRLLSEGGVFKDGSYDAGSFSGWIQLMSYPDGKTVCEMPFSATSSSSVGGGIGIGLRIRGIPITGAMPKPTPQQQIEDDFQANVWKAAQAVVDGDAPPDASP